MRPGWRVTFARFLLLAIQPWRRDPEARDALTWVVAVGDFFLSGVPAFFIWKAVDAGAEVGDLVVRFAQASLVVIVIGLTWAGLRLQGLRDREQTPRLALSLEGYAIAEPKGVRHDYWIAATNISRRPILGVTLRLAALSSLNGAYGLPLYLTARFRKQVGGGTQPTDIPVGATVRWDILSQEVGSRSRPGVTLCCDHAPSAPAPLSHHSYELRYTMTVQAYGDDLQDLARHRLTVDFWSESGDTIPQITFLKCVVVTPTTDAQAHHTGEG